MREGIIIKHRDAPASYKTFIILFFSIILIRSNSFAYEIISYLKDSYKAGKYLNLVFCPLNYQDKADFVKDRGALIRKLKITKPFDECNNFKFWYINLSPKEDLEVFKPVPAFPPLKVREDFLTDISSKIKGVYKLVIIDAEGSITCAELSEIGTTSLIIIGRSAYDNDNNFAKGFLHELGHSLGLRDECINCQQRSTSGYPNCASNKEEAIKWWGDLAGKDERVNYISGCCGNKDYIRPTIASLMNDFRKAEDFGPVNQRYLRRELGL
jgi:hypothetical protein